MCHCLFFSLLLYHILPSLPLQAPRSFFSDFFARLVSIKCPCPPPGPFCKGHDICLPQAPSGTSHQPHFVESHPWSPWTPATHPFLSLASGHPSPASWGLDSIPHCHLLPNCPQSSFNHPLLSVLHRITDHCVVVTQFSWCQESLPTWSFGWWYSWSLYLHRLPLFLLIFLSLW